MSKHIFPGVTNYILVDHEVVPCIDLNTWAKWFEENRLKRHVGDDTRGHLRISTVFLGLDHNFSGIGPPLLFETMIFNLASKHPWSESYQRRYATWDEAVAGHAEAIVTAEKMLTRADGAEDEESDGG